ncbi:hypothetical protein [Treponema sp.]|uniref:hypothetical protein n=1 Tax=Treponema sp. TaxID=166 RepID=UPI003EFF764F
MEIIDFYADGRQDFWKERIAESGWITADFLVSLIEKGKFLSTLGDESHFDLPGIFLGRSFFIRKVLAL